MLVVHFWTRPLFVNSINFNTFARISLPSNLPASSLLHRTCSHQSSNRSTARAINNTHLFSLIFTNASSRLSNSSHFASQRLNSPSVYPTSSFSAWNVDRSLRCARQVSVSGKSGGVSESRREENAALSASAVGPSTGWAGRGSVTA